MAGGDINQLISLDIFQTLNLERLSSSFDMPGPIKVRKKLITQNFSSLKEHCIQCELRTGRIKIVFVGKWIHHFLTYNPLERQNLESLFLG